TAPPIWSRSRRCFSPTRTCRSGCVAAVRSIRPTARHSTAATRAATRTIRRSPERGRIGAHGVLPELAEHDRQPAASGHTRRGKFFLEKYNEFTMENSRQLQCKALRKLQKIHRRKNNGKQ